MIKSISPKVMKLTDWEPDEKLQQHCHKVLGLTPDGKLAPFALADKYVPPHTTGGTDAAGNQNGARQ